VSVAGGTEVRVTGLALPDGARVLVGSSGAAEVVRSSATEVVFRAPARVTGRYDVAVFSRDGRSEVLTGALEYVAGGSGTAPTPSPTPSPAPSPAPGPAPSPGSGGGAGPTQPAELTGPGGLRLVRSARWEAVPASVWTTDCSSSCRGVVLRG
jgi:hypothetical protein